MVITSNNLGQAHLGIIDNHHKVVGWRAIGTLDDHIVEFCIFKGDGSLDAIVKAGSSSALRFKADQVRGIIVTWLKITAGFIILRFITTLHGCFTLLGQCFSATVTFVSFALIEQLLNLLLIQIKTFRLIKWTLIVR